jgi:hypothetical protein
MSQQQNPNNPKKRQIRLEIPRDLEAKYANAAVISQTRSEIILDFTQIVPNDPRARVQSRIIMTPTSAKSLLHALEKNLKNYEEKFGEISMPPTLADQLFGNLRDDNDNEDDE